jgi:hypothetical protein
MSMNEFKATANAHMRRDMEAGGKWACTCEACQGIRSLIGMDKMLSVRPLIRQVQQTREEFESLPDGPDRRAALERYLALHDRLADEMAK